MFWGIGMTEVEKKGIGKAKVGLVISVVLVVILAISIFWLHTNLQNRINTLSDDKYYLQTELYELQSTHENYVSTHSHADYEYDSLQNDYDDYVANHHYTDSEYDTRQFTFYYVKPQNQKFGVDELADELGSLEWTHPYEEGEFDCSEMSAYLEWYLENQGWHIVIIVGDCPFSSGRHSWLLVETSKGYYMPVEATKIEVVWWENPNFEDYFNYDHDFETVQDALAYSKTGFDWWNVDGRLTKKT